jgi:predicted PurR-regulated permease PerM
VLGNLIISAIAGASTFLVLYLLDVPYALPLAAIVAVLDLVPLVGATAGGVAVVIAAFAHGTSAGIVTLVFVVVYQQVENHLLQPIVMRRSVEVSPLVVIISVLVGATLAGIPGALLAIPVAASVQIACRQGIENRRSTMARKRETLAGERPSPVTTTAAIAARRRAPA